MANRSFSGFGYLGVVPAAIAALSAAHALGVTIPNQPGVLLLAVVYCAYRGGVAIGLAGAAIHVLFAAVFFSQPHHLFTYAGDDLIRAVVISMVAPAMGLMVGLLRREADRLNSELEARVLTRTAELSEARNIAEAAQAQTRLSEARFRDFATAASDWLWEQDENLRFCYFSPTALGGSRELADQHHGMTRREVGNAMLSAAEWDAHEADLAARRPFRDLMTRRYAADGKVRYTSTNGQPFFDETGRFCGYRGTARDVTKEILAELELESRVIARTEEVRALQQKLVEQERRATLDQLTATVSHELHNPLSAIRNSVYVITQLAHMSNIGLERPINRINRSIQRCENIIGQLVEYSQIRALQRRRVKLDTWLAEVLDAQTLLPGIAFDRALGAPGEAIFCDADHLWRVIEALIDNTVQAIQRAESEAPTGRNYRIRVESRVAGDRVEIAVIDDGPGIAPDVLARIFEPLFSTKAFGVGLGLPLAHEILDNHGGGIEVTSTFGAGTRALLWLPRAAVMEAAA